MPNTTDSRASSGTGAFQLEPIAYIDSPFKEKFGVPRQPGLVNLPATVIPVGKYNTPDAFRGLEAFSHIWLEFIFHRNPEKKWQPTVRPPRLGGNRRIGAFATRSSFRPNRLGLSAVKLIDIVFDQQQVELRIEGADLVHGTPIVDIKPYLPYSDAPQNVSGGYAHTPPPKTLDVTFSDDAENALRSSQASELRQYICEILALDPRPQYHSDPDKTYGMRVEHLNITWQVKHNTAYVINITRID